MRDVVIIGIGQTPVGEHWTRSLRHLAHDAIMPAMRDAGVDRVDALYVGNMLSGQLVGQEHIGALIADFVGLRGVEAMKVEAACGSGAGSDAFSLRVTDRIVERRNLAPCTKDYIARRKEVDYATYARLRHKLTMKKSLLRHLCETS